MCQESDRDGWESLYSSHNELLSHWSDYRAAKLIYKNVALYSFYDWLLNIESALQGMAMAKPYILFFFFKYDVIL